MFDSAWIDIAIKAFTTSIASTSGKTILPLLTDGTKELFDKTGQITGTVYNFFVPISKKYIKNYTDRHGCLKVLGMNKKVSLDSVYIKVNFKDDTIACYQTLMDIEQLFRKRDYKDKERVPAIDVANREEKLMVLGHPGSGKTTLLRKIGLEALKASKGEYNHQCIPVFLELRRFKSKEEINLVQAIAHEFQICGLPKSEKITEDLLNKGKLLILLDGLDEVPNDFLSTMTEEIRNIIDRYSGNRVIASCRIAAYRNFDNFRSFTDVSIADFDHEQIQTFITKWFESHEQKEWGKLCLQKLNSGDYPGAKELTKTPLLLTLICLLFKKTGKFPHKRATLYEKTLRVLLEEWDASKEIDRTKEEIYQGLDTKCKELMLAQVAYDNFIKDDLFFTRRSVSRQIEEALAEMLTEENNIDGAKVLRAVEAQHGVIIERQEDIYSFSHLTLQEYLTSLHIDENDIDIEQLVTSHLFDERWQEVFLILAGLKKADNLLLVMEKSIHQQINTYKLRNLLLWADKVANPISGDIQSVGKKAIVLSNANANAIAYAKANAIANANANAIANANANAIAIAYAYANANAIAIAFANAYANAYAYAIANANANAIAYANAYAKKAINNFIEYIQWSKKYQVYQQIDFEQILTSLKQLKTKIPAQEEVKEVHQAFGKKLIDFFLESFHLTHEMVNLSEEEIESLDNYFYSTWLIIQCKDAAVRYSPTIWQEIESRMFCLIDD